MKLILSHFLPFSFSPILLIFSHFLPLSSAMQLSNPVPHPSSHPWWTGPLGPRISQCGQRCLAEAAHVLLFHSLQSHQHDQGTWGINVNLQLNTQPCTNVPRRQDVTETWLCLLRSCTVTGGSHSKVWC